MTLALPILSDPPTQAARPVVLRDVPGVSRVLTPEVLAFLADLQSQFGPRLAALRAARRQRQAGYDTGLLPEFLVEHDGLP